MSIEYDAPKPNFRQCPLEYDALDHGSIYQQAPYTQVPIGKRKKIKLRKHLRREATEKEMDDFTNRVVRISEYEPFDGAYCNDPLPEYF